MKVFEDYLKENPYAEIVWSEKLSYIFLNIDQKRRQIMESDVLDCADTLIKRLCHEIVLDVMVMTGADHSSQNANSLEKAEIWQRLNPYLEKLPEYRIMAEKALAFEEL